MKGLCAKIQLQTVLFDYLRHDKALAGQHSNCCESITGSWRQAWSILASWLDLLSPAPQPAAYIITHFRNMGAGPWPLGFMTTTRQTINIRTYIGLCLVKGFHYASSADRQSPSVIN